MHYYTNDNKIMFAGNQKLTEYFQMLLFLNESTDDYLYLYDLKEKKIYFTQDITKRYPLPGSVGDGYSMKQWMSIVYGRDAAALNSDMDAIMRGEKTVHNIEYRLMDREGNLIWISCRGKVMFDQDDSPLVLMGRISDSILAGKADPLTGLMNLSKLLETLEQSLEKKETGILLVLGIDNFKHINKKYGRGYGNHVLKRTAALLENCVTDQFLIYRLDSDRFAMNLVGYQQSDVLAIYHDIQLQMFENYTLSAGAVSYPLTKIWDANTLFNYAESSLDRAKKEGKNRLCFFSEKEYEQQLYLIDLTEEMQQSIQKHFSGFSLHFQPQVAAHSYEITGAEALLRYYSPYHGSVSPTVFINILEQNGMIIPVGEWVLKEAITQCKKWRAHHPKFRMSINLSYLQLQQENFSDTVFSLLEQADLPGEAITLELTESMQLQNYRRFNQLFYQWEQRGIQISIDDFGTGYSSLSYLKSLAIDEIKIDRCFVSRIHMSAYNYHLLHNMLELARTAQIRVCCEGVETLAELQTLEQLYPDILQGFYFSKPLPADQFEKQYILSQQAVENWKTTIQNQITYVQVPAYLIDSNENYKTVLDQMDEIVYICDVESYELYYLNLSGKRLTGVNDYEGQKCYEVLQGNNAPCAFCINQKLQRNAFHVSHFENTYLNKRFLLKDKLITWNGKTARLEIAFDANKLNTLVDGIEEALHIEQNVVQVLTNLNDMQTTLQGTQELLKIVGEFYKADRSYIFLYSQEDQCWCNLYEWCEHQIESQQIHLLSVPNEVLQIWFDSFTQGNIIIVKDTEQYKTEAPECWKFLDMQNIHRLIIAPLINEGTIFGFIGVDNPKYLPYDQRFLEKLLPFVTTLFVRNHVLDFKDELIAKMTSVLQEENILKATMMGLWIIEIDTNANCSRMIVDKSMNDILGVESSLSSEDYYQHWYSNILPACYPYVNEAVQRLMNTNEIVEVQYPWNHPTRGEVTVRCVGICSKLENGIYTLKGYHCIVNDLVQTCFKTD